MHISKMVKANNFGVLCSHKITVNNKSIDQTLGEEENFCKYQCNEIKGCEGYTPLQEIIDFNKLSYIGHLNPKN